MPPEIRQLRPDNPPLLRAVNRLFAEVFAEPEVYAAHPPPDDYLKKLLAKEYFIALAALEGEQVIGALTAYELPKPEQARSEVYIYDLAVAEAHRRRGVATALIAKTQEIAAQRGAWVVYVQADRGDTPAVTLYTKLGGREDVHHFDLPVPAPAAKAGR